MQEKVLIIAEAGVNHNGSLDMALQLVDAAVDAGVDIVKFQTFKPAKVVSKIAPKAEYQIRQTQDNKSQLEMIEQLELSKAEHRVIKDYCKRKNIKFMSTPFDEDSLGFLVSDLNVDIIKISSGDLTNAPLLLKAAQTQRPIILSTGMGTLGEIEMALGVLAFGYNQSASKPSIKAFIEAFRSDWGQQLLKSRVTLLHCTTEYPAPYNEVNLRVMDTLNLAFGLPVGYSDHTMGLAIPVAAVARGARIIEKHFTLDKSLPGPDHAASLEPQELNQLVALVRQVEMALGSNIKIPTDTEIKNIAIARRSLIALKDIKMGDCFSEKNLGVKRPGNGISPFRYWELLGEVSTNDYEGDQLITNKTLVKCPQKEG